MTLKWKKCYVNVPLDDQCVYEHDCTDDSMTNVFTVELTVDDYDALFWLFRAWNDAFGILIDIFEEDEIKAEKSREALRILQNHVAKSTSSEFLAAAKKILPAVEKAVELNMPIYLDF